MTGTRNWTQRAQQFSPHAPMRDVCDIAEYVSELADKGEVDDINYANLKALPHKRLIYKVSVPGKWGKLYSLGSKKDCWVTRNKS